MVFTMKKSVNKPYTIFVSLILIFIITLSLTYFWFSEGRAKTSQQIYFKQELDIVSLTDAINNFTLLIYGSIAKDHFNKNLVVSPFNIYVALLMLYEGTNSATKKELGSVLGIYDSDACTVYRDLISKLPLGGDNDTRLYLANGAWLRNSFPFKESYVNKIRSCYQGDISYFANTKELIKEVNEWVKERTRGLIKEFLVGVPDNTVAVLVSAIYLYALWLEEFKSSTHIMFWTGEKYVEANAMEVKGSHLKVVESDNYLAVEIPYRGSNLSMVVIMPKDFRETLANHRNLILEALKRLDATENRGATLRMPKFEFEFKSSVKENLKSLGVREVFLPGVADLRGMADVPRGAIWVDDVIHQAIIKVNEKGTEAAAATAIIIVTALVPVTVIEINKPFIFIIRDRDTGVILFIGHVVDPTLRS